MPSNTDFSLEANLSQIEDSLSAENKADQVFLLKLLNKDDGASQIVALNYIESILSQKKQPSVTESLLQRISYLLQFKDRDAFGLHVFKKIIALIGILSRQNIIVTDYLAEAIFNTVTDADDADYLYSEVLKGVADDDLTFAQLDMLLACSIKYNIARSRVPSFVANKMHTAKTIHHFSKATLNCLANAIKDSDDLMLKRPCAWLIAYHAWIAKGQLPKFTLDIIIENIETDDSTIRLRVLQIIAAVIKYNQFEPCVNTFQRLESIAKKIIGDPHEKLEAKIRCLDKIREIIEYCKLNRQVVPFYLEQYRNCYSPMDVDETAFKDLIDSLKKPEKDKNDILFIKNCLELLYETTQATTEDLLTVIELLISVNNVDRFELLPEILLIILKLCRHDSRHLHYKKSVDAILQSINAEYDTIPLAFRCYLDYTKRLIEQSKFDALSCSVMTTKVDPEYLLALMMTGNADCQYIVLLHLERLVNKKNFSVLKKFIDEFQNILVAENDNPYRFESQILILKLLVVYLDSIKKIPTIIKPIIDIIKNLTNELKSSKYYCSIIGRLAYLDIIDFELVDDLLHYSLTQEKNCIYTIKYIKHISKKKSTAVSMPTLDMLIKTLRGGRYNSELRNLCVWLIVYSIDKSPSLFTIETLQLEHINTIFNQILIDTLLNDANSEETSIFLDYLQSCSYVTLSSETLNSVSPLMGGWIQNKVLLKKFIYLVDKADCVITFSLVNSIVNIVETSQNISIDFLSPLIHILIKFFQYCVSSPEHQKKIDWAASVLKTAYEKHSVHYRPCFICALAYIESPNVNLPTYLFQYLENALMDRVNPDKCIMKLSLTTLHYLTVQKKYIPTIELLDYLSKYILLENEYIPYQENALEILIESVKNSRNLLSIDSLERAALLLTKKNDTLASLCMSLLQAHFNNLSIIKIDSIKLLKLICQSLKNTSLCSQALSLIEVFIQGLSEKEKVILFGELTENLGYVLHHNDDEKVRQAVKNMLELAERYQPEQFVITYRMFMEEEQRKEQRNLEINAIDSLIKKLFPQCDELQLDQLIEASVTLLNHKWKQESILQLICVIANHSVSNNNIEQLFLDILNRIHSSQLSDGCKNDDNYTVVEILSSCAIDEWNSCLNEVELSEKNKKLMGVKDIDDLLLELSTSNKYNTELVKFLEKSQLRQFYQKIVSCYERPSSQLPDYRPICEWQIQDCIAWAKIVKQDLPLSKSAPFLPEMIAVIKRANILHSNNDPRCIQILSLYILLAAKNHGRLAQIATGEGKSTIVSMLAVIKVLQGDYVDIITSAEALASRDAKEKADFYSCFDITVADNCSSASINLDESTTISARKKIYQADVVYGAMCEFQWDYLKAATSEKDVYHPHMYRVAIVDEVDSMLLDGFNDTAFIAVNTSSLSILNGLFVAVWHLLLTIDCGFIEINEVLYWRDADTKEQLRIDDKYTFVTSMLVDYINDFAAGDVSSIYIPKHFKSFILENAKGLADSAYQAKYSYQPDCNYVISTKRGGQIGICPLFQDTGEVLSNNVWSKGLHQFLELKHSLEITPLHLMGPFISNRAYLKKYSTIYGLSGTLGALAEQKMLMDIYDTDVAIIPTFKQKNLTLLQPMMLEIESDWLASIATVVQNVIQEMRSVLIICETIVEVNKIQSAISDGSINIVRYTRTDTHEAQAFSVIFPKGNCIIATNLGGRGSDIKLTKAVNEQGGLFVILSFLPKNLRIQLQAIGRTARQGLPGSAQLIINKTATINDFKARSYILHASSTFEEIVEWRDLIEQERLLQIQHHKLEKIIFSDEIFSSFCNIMKSLRDSDHCHARKSAAEELWGLWLHNFSQKLHRHSLENSKPELSASFSALMSRIRDIYTTGNFDNPQHYIQLGNTWILSSIIGREVACGYYTKAIELDPINAAYAYYNRANCLLSRNKRSAHHDLQSARNSIENTLIPRLQSLILMQGLCANIEHTGGENYFKQQIEKRISILEKLLDSISNTYTQLKNPNNEVDEHISAFTLSRIKDISVDSNREVFDLYQEGLVCIYQPTFYDNSDDDDDSHINCFVVVALGMAQIIIGAICMPACPLIGSTLITHGLTDISLAIRKHDEYVKGGQPFDLEDDYFPEKGMNIAISVICMGFDKLVSAIKAHQAATAAKSAIPVATQAAVDQVLRTISKEAAQKIVQEKIAIALIQCGAKELLNFGASKWTHEVIASFKDKIHKHIEKVVVKRFKAHGFRKALVKLSIADFVELKYTNAFELRNLVTKILMPRNHKIQNIVNTIVKSVAASQIRALGYLITLSEVTTALENICNLIDDFCDSYTSRVLFLADSKVPSEAELIQRYISMRFKDDRLDQVLDIANLANAISEDGSVNKDFILSNLPDDIKSCISVIIDEINTMITKSITSLQESIISLLTKYFMQALKSRVLDPTVNAATGIAINKFTENLSSSAIPPLTPQEVRELFQSETPETAQPQDSAEPETLYSEYVPLSYQEDVEFKQTNRNRHFLIVNDLLAIDNNTQSDSPISAALGLGEKNNQLTLQGRFGSKEFLKSAILRYMMPNQTGYSDTIMAMPQAAFSGVVNGLVGVGRALLSPYDSFIKPLANLSGDTAIILSRYVGSQDPYGVMPMLEAVLTPQQQTIFNLVHSQAVADVHFDMAVDRMQRRLEVLGVAAVRYLTAQPPEQAEMLSEFVTNWYALGSVLRVAELGAVKSANLVQNARAVSRQQRLAETVHEMQLKLQDASAIQTKVKAIKSSIALRNQKLFGMAETPRRFHVHEDRVIFPPGTNIFPSHYIYRGADEILAYMAQTPKQVYNFNYVVLPNGAARYSPRVNERTRTFSRDGQVHHPHLADCGPVVSAGELKVIREWDVKSSRYDLKIKKDRTKSGNYLPYGGHLKALNTHVHQRHGIKAGQFEEYMDVHTDEFVYHQRKNQQKVEALANKLATVTSLPKKIAIMRRIINRRLFGIDKNPRTFNVDREYEAYDEGLKTLPKNFRQQNAKEVYGDLMKRDKIQDDYIFAIFNDGTLSLAAKKDIHAAHFYGINERAQHCQLGEKLVVSAGELHIVRGFDGVSVVHAKNQSGHYKPFGSHQVSMNEHVLYRHGFDVRGRFERLSRYEQGAHRKNAAKGDKIKPVTLKKGKSAAVDSSKPIFSPAKLKEVSTDPCVVSLFASFLSNVFSVSEISDLMPAVRSSDWKATRQYRKNRNLQNVWNITKQYAGLAKAWADENLPIHHENALILSNMIALSRATRQNSAILALCQQVTNPENPTQQSNAIELAKRLLFTSKLMGNKLSSKDFTLLDNAIFWSQNRTLGVRKDLSPLLSFVGNNPTIALKMLDVLRKPSPLHQLSIFTTQKQESQSKKRDDLVLEFAWSMLEASYLGLESTAHLATHIIDEAITPSLLLMWDSLVVLTCQVPISYYEQASKTEKIALIMLKRSILQNTTLYDESLERLNKRADILVQGGKVFLDAKWTDKIIIGTEVGVSLFAAHKLLHLAKHALPFIIRKKPMQWLNKTVFSKAGIKLSEIEIGSVLVAEELARLAKVAKEISSKVDATFKRAIKAVEKTHELDHINHSIHEAITHIQQDNEDEDTNRAHTMTP